MYGLVYYLGPRGISGSGGVTRGRRGMRSASIHSDIAERWEITNGGITTPPTMKRSVECCWVRGKDPMK